MSTVRFLGRRLLQSVVVLLVVVVASFLLIHLTPGSPLDGERALPPDIRQMLEAQYHLDKSVAEQLGHYIVSIFQLDFGESIPLRRPVSEIIFAALPASLLLGFQAIAFAVLFGVPLGFLIAARGRGLSADGLTVVSLVGVSIPNFVLAPLLILLFSFLKGETLALDWREWSDTLLPSASLGLFFLAYVARLARSGMAEVLRSDFVRTARAKGVSPLKVHWKHASRIAIQPVVSYLGPALAAALTGSIVIEKIFNVPGLGSHFVNGAFNRDYFLVLGVVIVYAALLIILNLLVDLLYGVLDPRVRHREGESG
jgi:oligopeptide transport system permease protein